MISKPIISLLSGLILSTALYAQTLSVSITSNAVSNTICSGTSVTFTATPTGTSSPLYQWRKNGTSITGATSSTYTTTGLVNNDVITVDLTEGSSNIVTSNLVLHLDAGQSSSYPGTGSTWTDLSGNGNHASLPPDLVSTYSSSIGGGSFQFQNSSNYPIQSSAMTNWNLSSTNALSVETWVKETYSGDYQFWFSTPDLYYRLGNNPSGNLFWDMAHYADRSTGNNISAGIWHHVVYTAGIESGNITTRVYIDGAFVTSQNEGVSALSTFTNYLIGTGQNIDQHRLNAYMGLIRVYNKALSVAEVAQNYNAQRGRFAGAVTSNTITTTVTASNTITLSSATGTNAQTLCNNSALTNITYTTTGATGATFSGLPAGVAGEWLGNVVTISGTPTITGSYTYTATLTGGCGNITASGSITVTTSSISITSSDADNSICNGAAVTFSTTVQNGGSSPAYQWYKNGAAISGATSSTYSTSSLNNIDAIYVSYSSTCTTGIGSLIQNGLIQNLDAGNLSSYSGSGSTISDLSGNGNNGTITGATYNSSGALSYFNNFGIISAPLTKTASMTFNVWAKTASVGNANMMFNAGNEGSGPDLWFINNGVYWNIWDSYGTPFLTDITNPGSVINSTTLVTDPNMHNYTVVVDAVLNNAKFYFDGVLKGTAAYHSPAGSTTLSIGSGFGVWNGGIASFQTYNRSLSATEVASNYNSIAPKFQGIIISNTIQTTLATNNTISLSSAAGTNAQTLCNNTAITNITYSTTGATGASFSGLPSGVNGAWSGNVVTISGTPSGAGSYSYSVTLTGGCGNISASGTVLVNSPSFTPATHTVAELQATGTNIKWYAAASGGTALSSATVLANGHYYASQTVNGNESTSRLDVTVTFDPTPCAPTAASPHALAAGASVDALTTLTGQNIKWYADALGGSALPVTTPLLSGTHTYYASQTVSCTESASRMAVVVTLP